ncbi:MAG: hypothetical protein GQ468_05290 [Candidatus Scalindua sp.]|nr:hypothetical protein [Candidatus Scalindua sp.]
MNHDPDYKARYEYIRRLNPRDFSSIYTLNIKTSEPFDDIIDRLITEYEEKKNARNRRSAL